VYTAFIAGGENQTLDSEVGRGRRKLRNDEFVDVCVGEDDDVMEGEMDGSVTYMGVERN